jgi:restriction system protein
MPRKRKRKQQPIEVAFVGMTVAAIVGVIVAAISALTFVVAAVFERYVSTSRWNVAQQTLDAVTDEHLDALIRERAMLVRSDSYGKPILDKWDSEVARFINHHVLPALTPSQQKLSVNQLAAMSQRISQRVAYAAEMRPALMAVSESMMPAEFEAFCAERLRACGWDVRLTPLSRDQGVDVIADKNGVRVVLQCKLYSNPVGNKAVQEIAAGRIHQQAHHGAVVTNCSYTTSAKELASTNGIRLLHHTDLPQLEQMLSMTATQ